LIITITAVSGDQRGKTQEYTFIPISIGRHPNNDIVITDTIVSRRHCMVNSAGKNVTLHDLESKNGTYVNGAKINTETKILDGDTITIGTINLQISISS
jgi:ABC transport system ATP-binding/permease protein